VAARDASELSGRRQLGARPVVERLLEPSDDRGLSEAGCAVDGDEDRVVVTESFADERQEGADREREVRAHRRFPS